MLALLLSLLHITIVTTAFGQWTIMLFKRLNWLEKEAVLPFDFVSILGLMSLGSVLTIAHFFVAISPIFQLILTVLCIGFCVKYHVRETLKVSLTFSAAFLSLPKWLLAPLSIFIFFLISEATSTPKINDLGLYHWSTIRWAEEFPTVFGIANLHCRLGFGSTMFNISAFFGLRSVFGQVIMAVNLYLFLLLIFRSIFEIFKNKNSLTNGSSILHVAFLFLTFFQLKAFLSSPSPDWAAAILTYFLIIFLLKTNENESKQMLFILIAMVVFALPTYKLGYALSPILVLIIGFKDKILKQKQFWQIAVSLGSFMLIPFFITNIIQTGYLIFPFPSLDLFNFDWKYPLSTPLDSSLSTAPIFGLNQLVAVIKSYAFIPERPFDEVLAMPFSQRLAAWWSFQTGVSKALLALAFASPISIFIAYLFKKSKFKTNENSESSEAATLSHRLTTNSSTYFLVWLFAFINFLFWFVSAPDFRFGSTFIIVAGLTPIILIINNLEKNFRSKTLIATSLIFSFYFLYVMALKPSTRFQMSQFLTTFIKPAPPQYMDLEKVSGRNLDYFISTKSYSTNDAPLPTTPYKNPFLEKRGATLRDGFRMNFTE